MQALLSLDSSVVETVALHRTWLGVYIAYAVTDLASPAVILALSFLLAVYFAHKHRRLVIPFVITIAGALASFELLKDLVARPRPPEALALYQAPLYSFPSGHATMVVAFFGFIAYFLSRRHKRFTRWYIYVAATLFILLVGASRVYLGVHYPTDVIGGYVLGSLWLYIGIKLVPKRHPYRG